MLIPHPLIEIALRLLPKRFHDHVVVFGSAPLVFAGLSESLRDLDLLVSEDVFAELIAAGFSASEPAPGVALIQLENVEVYRAWPEANFDELHADARATAQSGGLRVVSLRHTLALKLATNREKDQRDIQLLRDALR